MHAARAGPVSEEDNKLLITLPTMTGELEGRATDTVTSLASFYNIATNLLACYLASGRNNAIAVSCKAVMI